MSNAQRIEQEAAQWLLRRDNGAWTDDDQVELDDWLDQGFAHKAAYWRLEEGWAQADRVAALGLIAPGQRVGQRSIVGWKPIAVAASLALVSLVGVTQLGTRGGVAEPRGQAIATVVGGHKVVQLNDGSKIELNTATLVNAAVTTEKREVWLQNGEAFFDVLHSDTVPFVVHAGPKTITVLGTKFSVRRDGDKVTVAVLQGRVRVTEAKDKVNDGAIQVAAGSIAVTEPDAALVTNDAGPVVDAELAWRGGQLVFRNDTLAEAADEFNRYNDQKLVVTGRAAQLKIGGTFKASNVDGFARLLRDAYGLNVSEGKKQIRVTDE